MLSTLLRPFRRAASQEVVDYGNNPACRAAIEATNKIVFDTLTVPKPNPVLVEERKIYQSADLDYQIKLCDWRLRCRLMRDMGFLEYNFREAVTLLTGREVSTVAPGRFRWEDDFGWRDSGDMDQAEADFLEIFPTLRSLAMEISRNQPMCTLKGTKERVLFGPMKELRISIPAGAVLKMQALKKLKSGLSVRKGYRDPKDNRWVSYEKEVPLIDEFTVLAPEWCWANPQPKDPILFGMIAGPYNRASKVFDHRLYMLARWE